MYPLFVCMFLFSFLLCVPWVRNKLYISNLMVIMASLDFWLAMYLSLRHCEVPFSCAFWYQVILQISKYIHVYVCVSVYDFVSIRNNKILTKWQCLILLECLQLWVLAAEGWRDTGTFGADMQRPWTLHVRPWAEGHRGGTRTSPLLQDTSWRHGYTNSKIQQLCQTENRIWK